MRHYHVRSEMDGGYMPDDVATFRTRAEARAYAADMLRRWRDDCATEAEFDDSQTGDPGRVVIISSGSCWAIEYASDTRLSYLLILDSCYEQDCED